MAASFEYASEGDLAELAQIVRTNFPDVGEAQVMQNVYDGTRTRVLVLRKDATKEVLGVAVFRTHDDADFADLIFFCTTAKSQGLGNTLLKQLKEDLAEEGDAHYILLYSGHDAVDFWKKFGFVEGLPEGQPPEEMVKCRMEHFENAVLMGFDMTAEFESEAAQEMRKQMRPGDLVMVRHGNRFPTWRQAWVTDTSEKKLYVKYTDLRRETEWIPFGSKRLLSTAIGGDAALEEEPAAFEKKDLELAKKQPAAKKSQTKAPLKKAAPAPPKSAPSPAKAPAPPKSAPSPAKAPKAVKKKIAKPKKAKKAPAPPKSAPSSPAKAAPKAAKKATPKKKPASPEKKQKTPPKWAPASGYVTKRGRHIVHK